MPSTKYVTAVLVAAGLLLPVMAWAGDNKFYSTLDPAPMTMATRANVAGSGSVSAILKGNVLTVEGRFSDLASPATGAHLREGAMTGMPGDVFAALTATQGESGTISGAVTLDRDHLKALRAGSVYVQIDSEKAPDGTLRAWLLSRQP